MKGDGGGEMTDTPRSGGKKAPDEESFLASTIIGSNLRWENRPVNRPVNRDTGLEMPCCPVTDLLWV